MCELSSRRGPHAIRTRQPLAERVYWLVVALIVLFYLAACLAGIANVWVWGHNGFNGSAFAQAARNTIRFDTWAMAQYHMGLAPPGVSDFYTHHPMMMHVDMVAMFKLFGYSEWAARLPSALYAWGSIVPLFLYTRRYHGPWVALVSIVAYALIPLNLVFANMITHQHGSLFWCLVFLYGYCRWRESGGWGWFAAVMIAVSLAVQYDWPAYYVAFFTVVHAFAAGVRRQTRLFEWRREYTFCAVFSFVVLLNALLYFLFIVDVRGGWSDMAEAFSQRTAATDGYLALLLNRSLDLYGPVFLTVIPVWLLVFFVRTVRGRSDLGDLVPFYFLLAQCIHSTLFKNAGFIHSYWTYNLNPGLAVMVGVVLVGLVRWLGSSLTAGLGRLGVKTARPARAHLVTVCVAILLIGVPMLWQAQFAARQYVWGKSNGDAAYKEPYDDQYIDLAFTKHLARRFNRTNADFLVHSSLDWRIEPLAYLDAPNRRVFQLRASGLAEGSDRHQILLADLDRVTHLKQIATLLQRHPAWIYNERFLAVDLSSTGHDLTVLNAYAQRSSWWWTWLVSFKNPPIDWVESEPTPAIQRLVRGGPELEYAAPIGGGGGGSAAWHCPIGHGLTGLNVWTRAGGDAVVRGLQPYCAPLDGNEGEHELFGLRGAHGLGAGDRTGSPAAELRCPVGQAVVGIYGRAGDLIDALGVDCGPISESASAASLPDPVSTSDNRPALAERPDPIGGAGGSEFERRCAPGSAAVGFRVASGALVDRLQLMCSRVALDPPP